MYTLDRLCELAHDIDAGFDRQSFAGMLGRIDRLDDEDFTEYGVSKPWKFVRADEQTSVTGLCRWQSNNGHCLLAAARDSLGLAYLPDYYVAEDIAGGRLVRVLEEWGGIERDVVAIYQHRRHLSAKVKLFVDFLEKRFRQRRPW